MIKIEEHFLQKLKLKMQMEGTVKKLGVRFDKSR